MLLHDSIKAFFSHHYATVNVSTHTKKAYESDLRHFHLYAGAAVKPCDVDKEALRGYIRHMRDRCELKETTIKRRIACLKLFFRWATEEGMLSTNPFEHLGERIRLPRRLPRSLGKDEIVRLKAIATKGIRTDDFQTLTNKIAIGLLIATGIRVGELVNICLDDLDLVDGSIKIHGKGNRQRIAYVLEPLLSTSISRYLGMRGSRAPDNPTLLVSVGGKPITTDNLRQALRRTAKNAGIPRRITPHMLRHTAASRWLEAGLDIRYVQKLLGHHSIATTEIYTHVTDNGLRRALQQLVERRTDN
jgi:integrase/recombinase XerD